MDRLRLCYHSWTLDLFGYVIIVCLTLMALHASLKKFVGNHRFVGSVFIQNGYLTKNHSRPQKNSIDIIT